MPPEEWQTRRAEFIEALGQLFESPSGIAFVALIVVLGLGAIAASALLLVHLRRRTPPVPIPLPHWGGADLLLLLICWYFFQAFLATAVAELFPVFPATEVGLLLDRLARDPMLMAARLTAGALGSLVVAGAVILLPRLHAQPLSVLGIGTGSFAKGVGQGALVWLCGLPGGFALLLGWIYTLLLLGIEPDPQIVVDLFRGHIADGNYAPAVSIGMFGTIIAPIVEELLFRVVLFRWLTGRFGLAVGVVGSSVIFGLVHGSLFALLPITVLGAVLALLYHRTGNLWSCVGLHAIFNTGQFALMITLEFAGLG